MSASIDSILKKNARRKAVRAEDGSLPQAPKPADPLAAARDAFITLGEESKLSRVVPATVHREAKTSAATTVPKTVNLSTKEKEKMARMATQREIAVGVSHGSVIPRPPQFAFMLEHLRQDRDCLRQARNANNGDWADLADSTAHLERAEELLDKAYKRVEEDKEKM